MTVFRNIIYRISDILNGLAGITLILLMILSFMDVALRFFFNRPIQGTYEVSGLLALIIISFALAKTQINRGHIRVDILFYILPKSGQKILGFLIDVLCLAMSVIICWQSFVYANSLRAIGEASQTQKIPFAPFEYIVATGFLVLSLVLLYHLVARLMGRTEK